MNAGARNLTIEAAWRRFEAAAMPREQGFSDVQRQEMRRAFYAGAASFLGITTSISEGDVSEIAAVAVLEGIANELGVFAEDLAEGRA